ncbi:YecA family protein [Propionivibrio sp.]|uniref:YecA/YgfB family protein n=1 Tax=Propionivibrio sp. TaxID=2212460 RepID=UPI003BF21A42
MTTESTVQAQLPDNLLDRLETLLDDPALLEAMRLDEIQGYLCAALSGPQPIPEEDWLADALGSEEALDTEAGREAAELLRAFAVALEEVLTNGEPPVLLLYPKDDDENGPSDYLPWCQAYLAGVDAAEDDWFEFLGEEEGTEDSEEISYLDERLFPLMLLTGEAEAAALEHGEAWAEGEERAQVENDCEEDLPQAVADIYRFWIAKRGTQPIRR